MNVVKHRKTSLLRSIKCTVITHIPTPPPHTQVYLHTYTQAHLHPHIIAISHNTTYTALEKNENTKEAAWEDQKGAERETVRTQSESPKEPLV